MEEDAKEKDNLSNMSSTNSNNSKGKRKGAKKKESNNKKIKNDKQFAEFVDGKTWEKTFQGKCPDSRVKFTGIYMCPRFHTKGECWSKGCKYKKSHLSAKEVPDNKKQAHIEYMAECRRKSSIK
jgi:hypothetical protein